MARNLVHADIDAAAQEIAQGAGMIYGWMSTRKQTLATMSRMPYSGDDDQTGVSEQQTHLAKNCIVQNLQKQRYTALEQHDSMQDAHMSYTRVASAKNKVDHLMAAAFRVQLFTALTESTLYVAHLAFVWMKSNSQLLVLAFDGQGIYTSLHLHRQHAVDAVINMKQTREALVVRLGTGTHCCKYAKTDICSHIVKRPPMHCPWQR